MEHSNKRISTYDSFHGTGFDPKSIIYNKIWNVFKDVRIIHTNHPQLHESVDYILTKLRCQTIIDCRLNEHVTDNRPVESDISVQHSSECDYGKIRPNTSLFTKKRTKSWYTCDFIGCQQPG